MRPKPRVLLLPLLLIAAAITPLRAVLVSGSYLTTDPGDAASTGISAWDYVGSLNGLGGVYLGNDWVITAGHVGATVGETYTLDGYTYTVTASAAVGSADLLMFQISGTTDAATAYLASLGTLSIAASTPALNSSILMIGYGGGSESYGTSPVYDRSYTVTDIGSYTSKDYILYNGGGTYVVGGDSGGAGFVYNSSTHLWDLSGILEVQVSYTQGGVTTYGSGLVDLSQYTGDIAAIMGTSAVPEPGALPLGLLGLGLLGLGGFRARRQTAASAGSAPMIR